MLRGGEKLLEEGHEPSRAGFSSGPDMPDMPDRPAGDARDLVAGSGLLKICHTPVLERPQARCAGWQVGLPHGRSLFSASLLPPLFHVNRHSSRNKGLLSNH